LEQGKDLAGYSSPDYVKMAVLIKTFQAVYWVVQRVQSFLI